MKPHATSINQRLLRGQAPSYERLQARLAEDGSEPASAPIAVHCGWGRLLIGHTFPDPASLAQYNAQLRGLDTFLRRLPDEQRACWVLRELHDLTYPEIAFAMNLPVSTVRGRLARARQNLTKGMSAWR